MRPRLLASVLACFVLSSCEAPADLTWVDPSFAISDAAHSPAVEHFYFLPPMVPDPLLGGVFDATRSPSVEICLFDTTANACAEDQPANFPIVFTMDGGPGSETVRLSVEDEHYIVNWHTDEFGLDSESTYRIFVKEPGPVGYTDIDVVGSGGEVKGVNTQEFIPLVNNRTLPIKFRIEEGLAFALDGNGGEVAAAGGDVVLDFPEGAVTTEPGEEPVPVTVDPVPQDDPSLPEGATGLEGSVYDMGPDGLQFEEPVELTFTYDAAALTAANPNAREEDLAIFVLENGVWVPLDDVTVDVATKKVSGFTTHFSTFGVLTLTRACPGGGPEYFETVQEAYDATMPGGAMELCDATHSVEGLVLDAPVTIVAEVGATPVIQTSTELAAFWVDGYATGTVLIDGLTFDFQTPDGGSLDDRSYAIRAQGTYDQLIVRNSTFNVDPGSRGSVFSRPSTVTGAATTVENVTIFGGDYGVSAQSTHMDVLGSDFDGLDLNGTIHFGSASPASGRVEGSTFGQCGTGRCIYVISGAIVDVVSNTFAAPVLTGDGGPDQNQVIFFGGAASGLIDQNVFAGCGYWTCVDITSGATVTVTANEFNHLPGQSALEWQAVSILDLRRGASVTVDGNTLNSCGVICYKVLDGATVTIRNETVSTPSGHGTQQVVLGAEDDPLSVDNTITFEDNVVTGSGAELGVALFTPTAATVNRNTFTNLAEGAQVNTGSTLTGRDNVFGVSGTGLSVFEGYADFRFNDFTGQATDIGAGGDGTSDLTCNYWGNSGGPQVVDASVPSSMYTPWALASIAGTGATGCTTVRVATSDDGSGLPFFSTLAEAVSLVPSDGTILVSDGPHSVEGLVLDAPVTIVAEVGATPVIQTSTELAAFWVDGYATGTVLIDGLTFDFQTPDGGSLDDRSYAIRAQGTYDQLIVRNSTFNVDPGSRGSVFSRPSTVTGAATTVENVTIFGGDYGVSAQSTHMDVLGSDFDGLDLNGTIHFGSASPASGRVEGSTFGQCGTGRCIYVISGAIVDVVSNTFAAPVLTGDGGPDQNQVIFFGGAASGLIDQNVFAGCGYWTCVDITSGATVTVTANEFNHLPGQSALEWQAVSILDLRRGASVTVDGNTLNSCGVICYKVLDGATVTIRNETVSTPSGHGTQQVVLGAEDDPLSVDNTITFEDNVVTGSGAELGVALFTPTAATVNRNTFTNLAEGAQVNTGSTLTGRDNVFGVSGTGLSVFEGYADFRFNDFTGQATDIGAGGDGTSDLTCNYWGNSGGPQVVDASVPSSMYTPWAVASVASTGASSCSGS